MGSTEYDYNNRYDFKTYPLSRNTDWYSHIDPDSDNTKGVKLFLSLFKYSTGLLIASISDLKAEAILSLSRINQLIAFSKIDVDVFSPKEYVLANVSIALLISAFTAGNTSLKI